MRKIKIFDTTLRDGEQSPGCSMSIEDKVKIAKILDDMKVDVIEAGFAASNEKDFESIKRISSQCSYSIITSLARCNKNDIDMAYEAIKDAKNKRIHVFIATSEIHMHDKLRKTPEEVKLITQEMVSYAKSKCEDIEFSLEDATRTNWNFACEIIDIAIKAGATTINIPDTVGFMTPFEFSEFISYLRTHSMLDMVDISVHCHNDLGLATSNTLAAIIEGANQVEVTVNGIGERAGNTALEEIVAIIDTKKSLGMRTDVYTQSIKYISDIVVNATGSFIQNNKAIVGNNAFKHESGIHQAGVIKNRETYEIIDPTKYGICSKNIVIGIHSGKNAIVDKMQKLQFDISLYDIDKIVYDIKSWLSSDANYQGIKIIPDEIFIQICYNNAINQKVKKSHK